MNDSAAVAEPPAPAVAEEFVTLVNQGRGDLVVLPGRNGTLKKASGNTLSVPKELADKIRRNNKYVKNVKDIFPDSPDLAKLAQENADLRRKADALEKLLNLSDKAKADANAAFQDQAKEAGQAWEQRQTELLAKIEGVTAAAAAADSKAADLAAQVATLSGKLADFQAAKNKSDLDAVKEKHAEPANT